MAVTLTLADEIDVSRGDMLVHPDNVPRVDRHFEAMVVWMAEEPLAPGKQYWSSRRRNLVTGAVSHAALPRRRQHAAPRGRRRRWR